MDEMNHDELQAEAKRLGLPRSRNDAQLRKLIKEQEKEKNMRESSWSRVMVLVVAVALLLLCGFAAIRVVPALAREAGKVVEFIRQPAAVAVSEPQTQATVVVVAASEPLQVQMPIAEETQLCDKVTQYDRPPQPQVGHPSYYNETGVSEKSGCWEVELRDEDFVLIAGGYIVNGREGGVYTAVQGPATVEVSITDGFIAIVVDEWAEEEFCFRVGQAVEFGWSHEIVEPLPGWDCSSATAIAVATVANTQTASQEPVVESRRPSGANQTIRFSQGEKVYGWKIVLDSGAICDGGECYLPSAPAGGEVTSGVVNPWEEEIPANTTQWNGS